jgi:hydrogenase maturation protease
LSKKVGVFGLGNTLRRDDGIGIIILESLLKFYKRKDLDYLNFGTASFDLLNRIKDYDRVLLIDGINASLPAGEVKIFKLESIKYNLKTYIASTHEIGLKSIFELSKILRLKTKIFVAGIQVKDISYKEGLSEALREKEKNILKEISAFIDKTLCSPH